MSSLAFFAIGLLLTVNIWCGVKPAQGHSCDCSYHAGGCAINKAAPAGFKCQCKYKGGWTCSGSVFPCVGDERCPGNLADPCACELGRGDCDGYYKDKRANCANSGFPRPGVAGSADCDCTYSSGGCTIKTPAPNGWKCVCVYKGFWTCTGWAQQCYADEKCLGGDYSYCGCKQGGGNCDAYPDKPRCNSPFVSKTCDCNRGSDWSKGLYDIESVQYETSSANIQNLQPSILAVKGIPNHTGASQTIAVTYGETVTKTSSYEFTKGIQIDSGVKFSAGIPFLAEAEASVNIGVSRFHTWGRSESVEENFQGEFTCNGAPYKYTQCSVTVRKAKVDVPYVMRVKHKQIQNCVCESHGVWKGTQVYNAHLVAKELGDCQNDTCGNTFGK